MTRINILARPAEAARRIAAHTYPAADEHDLDDLAQDAWIGINNGLRTFEEGHTMTLQSWCWLHARAYMRGGHQIRTHPRNGAPLRSGDLASSYGEWEPVTSDPGFDRAVDRVFILECARDAGLTPRQAEILGWVATHGDDRHTAEVWIEELGATSAACRSSYAAAINKVRFVARHGRPWRSGHKRGLEARATVLDWEKVTMIRERYAEGEPMAWIARDLGVDPKTVRAVCHGTTWDERDRPAAGTISKGSRL